MNAQVIVGLVIASTMVTAQWTEWAETPSSPCSQDCGMFGVRVAAERSCPTGGCPGQSQRTEKCGSKLCLFPKRTCTIGYIKGLVGKNLKCVKVVEEETTEHPTTV